MNNLKQIITKPKFHFSACHFIEGFGKCERLHGHDYKLSLTLEGKIDQTEQYLDFNIISRIVEETIMTFNQKILLPDDTISNLTIITHQKSSQIEVILTTQKKYIFPLDNVVIIKGAKNITCEELAKYFYKVFSEKIKKSGYYNGILSVSVNETPYSGATFSGKIN